MSHPVVSALHWHVSYIYIGTTTFTPCQEIRSYDVLFLFWAVGPSHVFMPSYRITNFHTLSLSYGKYESRYERGMILRFWNKEEDIWTKNLLKAAYNIIFIYSFTFYCLTPLTLFLAHFLTFLSFLIKPLSLSLSLSLSLPSLLFYLQPFTSLCYLSPCLFLTYYIQYRFHTHT